MTTDHPPVAEGVICVDFDKTLWEWGDLDIMKSKPLPGAVEAVRALKEAGYSIVIFTSRMSRTWWKDEAPRHALTVKAFADWQDFAVKRALARAGIPYDRITAEKVPAIAYIDDKAVEFAGDWDAVLQRFKVESTAVEYFMPRYWSGGNQRWHEVGAWNEQGHSATPLCRLAQHIERDPYSLQSCWQRGGFCSHYLSVHEVQKAFNPPEHLCKHCARVSAKRAAEAAKEAA